MIGRPVSEFQLFSRRRDAAGSVPSTRHDESDHRGAEGTLEDGQRQHKCEGGPAFKPCADVPGRYLKKAGQEYPQADDFAAIHADEVDREQDSENPDADHCDGFRQSLLPAAGPPPARHQRRREQRDLSDTRTEEKFAEIFPNPDRIRPLGLDVEIHRVDSELLEHSNDVEAEPEIHGGMGHQERRADGEGLRQEPGQGDVPLPLIDPAISAARRAPMASERGS